MKPIAHPLRWALVLAAVLFSGAALAAPFSVKSVPNAHLRDKNSYVSDPGKVLRPDATAAVNKTVAALERRTGAEIAVVVLKDVGDNDAREFATDLFRHWGLGKKGKDNGLLILLITEPPQRSVIFETGYGLEGVLPDVVCYRLQQRYMVPDFKKGDFSAGMVKGVDAVAAYLAADKSERTAMTAPQKNEQPDDDTASVIIVLLFIAFFLYLARRNPKTALAILGSLRRGGRGGGGSWGGGSSGGGGASSRF